MLLSILINIPAVQNFLVSKATAWLVEKLDTKVNIDAVNIRFFNRASIQGLYIEDKAGDTLLYAGQVHLQVTDLLFSPVIRNVTLHDVYCHLYRTAVSDEWNYAFIEDAFSSPTPKDTTRKPGESTPIEIDLKKVALKNVRFYMDDAWVGSDFDIGLGEGIIEAKKVDLPGKKVVLKNIQLFNPSVILRDYQGGRPPRIGPRPPRTIDTTAFNPDLWSFYLDQLTLANGYFSLDVGDKAPYPDGFDPDHIHISGIDLESKNLSIIADTIQGKVLHLAAKDRSGLEIKHMSAQVSVSPNASICKDLLLLTPHSRVENYYAMHYERFPDFEDYIDKVYMVAHLHKSTISAKDIAYFAPELRDHPLPLYASGNYEGTVSKLKGENMQITDGKGFLTGNIRISGLPDIKQTFIHYQEGEIFTPGDNIYAYAPQLDTNTTVNLKAIQYFYFKGEYAGFIDNFGVSGVIKTNLGNIISDVKLDIPDFNAHLAIYSGTVKTEAFDIGRLLNQPLLGHVSMNVQVSGKAFHQHTASITLNGTISRLDINDYSYEGIILEGILAHKKFDGTLMLNDPNLILAFYGSIDFSQEQIQLSARSNLLHSNLKALNITEDTTKASADFDLNFQGNNIDDFTGYAKLYHINVLRNNNRLDIDSVYFVSKQEDGKEVMTLESNDISGRITGDFRLTDLLHSLQHYLSRYMPNYIPEPQYPIVEQKFDLAIETLNVDTLLPILFPGVKGFSNSILSARFNTFEQELSINLRSPGGSIGQIQVQNISISGIGNYNELLINARTGNLVLGEDVLSLAMVSQAKIGQDSVHFTVTTSTSDDNNKATLNGEVYASGDTLYITLLPSEIFLNHYRWEIPSGNDIVFSKNYLFVNKLELKSGIQKISIYSGQRSTEGTLHANIKDLNITMLGNSFGIASYHPSGQINGTLKLSDIFSEMQIDSRLVATQVKFGADTIGTIRLSGIFTPNKGLFELDRESGIYYGKSFVRTTGSIARDSLGGQNLQGYVQLEEAKISWLAPFLSEYLSGMQGTVTGLIRVDGDPQNPNLEGKLNILNAAVKIQMTGATYSIPEASVLVNNQEIDFGNVTLYDSKNNTATLTGGISHDRLKNMRFNRTRLTSPKFTVLQVSEKENKYFYGNLVANVKSLTVSGPFDDVRMNIQAAPVSRSHIFIPVQSGNDIHTYSFVSFKQKDEEVSIVKKAKSKFSLTLVGDMNPLATISLVLDPSTGDMINANGHGNITLNLPSNDDMKMFGTYEIEEGDYTFTFKQLYFRRNFKINSGSRISFNGPIDNTNLNINAIYTTRARLSDILQEQEKEILPDNELRDAKTAQDVDVLLYMTGTLSEPRLNFNIDLPEKRSEGTYAYQKLKRLNQNDRELFDQVASLLLINTFYPPEGMLGSSAISGGVNNFSEILSTTASSQLTNIVNKLLKDPNLAVELKYKNYQLSDPASYGGINRNEVSFNVRKSLFQERLIVELGSAYDWGRPAASNQATSNLNLAGDFRLQYLLTPDGRFRLNAFRTTNYDVLVNDNIYRGGVGLSYRKSFNTLGELLRRRKSISYDTKPIN